MNSYPRSATVRAAEDVTVLEMGRNVLYILQRSKTLQGDARRARIAAGRSTTTSGACRSSRPWPRTPPSSPGSCDLLRDRVTLERKNNGELIFEQGDPADAFYLIRTGFVKVAQSHMGGRARPELPRAGRLLRRDRPAGRPARGPGPGRQRRPDGPRPARRWTTSTSSRSPPRRSTRSSTSSPRSAARSSSWPSSGSRTPPRRSTRSRTCRWPSSSARA